MAFQLTISEGKEAGREFVFDQESILIGRIDECDVILYDPGISRRHCRIFSQGDAHFVEDMGSANGTRVNGDAVLKKQRLEDGDRVTLGPVVFSFAAVMAAAEDGTDPSIQADEDDATRIVMEPTAENPDATRIVSTTASARPKAPLLSAKNPKNAQDGNTRIVSPEQLKLSRGKGVALAPKDAGPDKLAHLQRSRTTSMPATRAPSAIRPAARPVRNAARGSDNALSAADRARIRRESSAWVAQLRLFWLEARPAVRSGILGAGVVLVLGLVGLGYAWVLRERAASEPGDEPATLSVQPIADSFGLGEGVKWERPDQKIFTWQYTAATRAVVLVHFQAQGISQGEVILSVNGVDVGKVPPDTLASQERGLELTLPPQVLRKGEPNRITFDNTRNPPGRETWRIWNLWVETALLPELLPEQLLQEATNAFKRGSKNLEAAEVGARNRYEAWRAFREAWLLLEAYPSPKPSLYQEARDKVRQAQQELDKTCSKLLLEVETYYNQGNPDAAAATLEHVRSYFPEHDQPCLGRALSKRAEYNL